MFALRAGREWSGRTAPGFSLGHREFILPRWLRKPARLFARFVTGEVEAPRYSATIASGLLICSAVIAGTVIGGHGPLLVKEVTARSGFAVDEIAITGNRETSEIDIFGQIGLDGWTSMVGLDALKAREAIAELPWIESVAVRKVYPSRLEVSIVEKEPFAIWQRGRELSLIEVDGSPIVPLRGARHADLPVVIGVGAAEAGRGFIETVSEFPELSRRVAAYVRVSDRRWNLRMRNGMTVKLPATGAREALADLAALDRDHQILSRDMVAIDMRLADRFVFRLGEEGLKAREAALRERLGRAYRPQERRI